MAMFCTHCGTALPSAAGFCPSCGAVIGTPVAAQPAPAPNPIQVPPLPPAAYGQVGAYPVLPPKKSGGALKVVLIVIAVVVGLGVLGFGALVLIGLHAAKTVNATNGGTGVTATVPGVGTVTTGTAPALTAQDLGVPLYPGATFDASASATVVNGTTKAVQATYWTTDPVSAVTAFYQSKLGSGLTVMGLGDETILDYGGGNNTVTIMMDSESGKTKMNVIHSITAQ